MSRLRILTKLLPSLLSVALFVGVERGAKLIQGGALAIALLIGALWHFKVPGVELLMLLLPLLWWFSSSRWAAGGTWLFFYLALSVDVIANYITIYPNDTVLIPIAIWVGHAAILTLPWVLLWRRSELPPKLSAALAMGMTGLGFLISGLPPLGTVSWVHPLIAAGSVFPGQQEIGVVLTLFLVFALFAAAYRLPRAPQMLLAVVLLSVAANMLYTAPQKPEGWVGATIERGEPRRDDDLQWWREENEWLAGLALDALERGAQVVVLPEMIAGESHMGNLRPWAELAKYAAANDRTVVFGALNRTSATRYQNGVVILSKDGLRRAGSRLPMPVGLWRPWSRWSAEADWFGLSQFNIGGRKVALSVCFEDFMLYPFMLSMLPTDGRRPDVVISMANNWFAKDRASVFIQSRTIYLMSRLYGVPLVRSVGF